MSARAPGLAAAVLLAVSAVYAQSPAAISGYWVNAAGQPWRDASGQCVRGADWNPQKPQPGCDPQPAAPDRVVLLPGPDGRAGAVIVRSAQGEQRLDVAYGSTAVARDGRQTQGSEDPTAVQQRYAAVLQVQPQRPVSMVVQFASGSATELTPESRPVIEQLKALLAARTAPEITVIGHTDRVGAVEANDRLSLRRAEAVRAILSAAGVAAARMEVAGRGEREPLVPTEDEVAEPRNRRVEINVR